MEDIKDIIYVDNVKLNEDETEVVYIDRPNCPTGLSTGIPMM